MNVSNIRTAEVKNYSNDELKFVNGVNYHRKDNRISREIVQPISLEVNAQQTSHIRGNNMTQKSSDENSDDPNYILGILSMLLLAISPFLVLINWVATVITTVFGMIIYHEIRHAIISGLFQSGSSIVRKNQ